MAEKVLAMLQWRHTKFPVYKRGSLKSFTLSRGGEGRCKMFQTRYFPFFFLLKTILSFLLVMSCTIKNIQSNCICSDVYCYFIYYYYYGLNGSDIVAFSINLRTKCVFLVMFRNPPSPLYAFVCIIVEPPPPPPRCVHN